MKKRHKKRYKRLTYLFEESIEIYEYLDGRYGAPGEKREKKKEPTPEQIKKRNQWNRERKARHKLKTWFHENDCLFLLTYRRELRPPNMKAAKKDFRKAVRKIRREYKKKGCELRWMRNIEVGPKGAWHVHLVINRIPDADLIVKKAWLHGQATLKLLYEEGGFADLAGYITKTPETANKYGENLVETDYSASRNLPVKEPRPKKLTRWPKKLREKEGFCLDKTSFYEGINPATGCRYRYYTLIRINRRI